MPSRRSLPPLRLAALAILATSVFGCSSVLGLEAGERGDSGVDAREKPEPVSAPDARADVDGESPTDTSPVETPDTPPAKDAGADPMDAPATDSASPPVDARDAGACPKGMLPLGGGTFKMGERGDTVRVEPFCLDRFEVDADAYALCATVGKCTLDGVTRDDECNYGKPGRGAHPINCIDWSQAVALCTSMGKRLPTEEEWEWAARGAERGWTYPWGDEVRSDGLCWSSPIERTGTCAVGAFPRGASPAGFMDLAGNVWEWTTGKVEGTDPEEKVYRGGGWLNAVPKSVRADHRSSSKPLYRSATVGVRCAGGR